MTRCWSDKQSPRLRINTGQVDIKCKDVTVKVTEAHYDYFCSYIPGMFFFLFTLFFFNEPFRIEVGRHLQS